jgi:sortase A
MSRFVPVLIAAVLFFIAPVWAPPVHPPAAFGMVQEKTATAPFPSAAAAAGQSPEQSKDVAEQNYPDGKTAQKMAAAPVAHAASVSAIPERLSIPKIKLGSPIVPLGSNSKGEMDVPSGDTNNVGWYKEGTVPGAIGSAVLDAHVYAAFKNLRKLKAGDDIYVGTEGGKRLHFRVTEMKTYALRDVPLQKLFNRADARRLNLITCAGTYMPSKDTYSHRLIVYATLING